ncbi:MAG: protein kinase [Caldilineaceae bacterium]
MADIVIPGYKLISRLATYGPGETWKAHAKGADQFVVIHLLPLDEEITENDQRKFLREAGICARLNHPGLVRFLTQGISNKKLWFITELVQGIDLAKFIQNRQPITVDTAVNIIQQVQDVIIYLYQQGIVHRGLRPESLAIEEKGQGLTVRVVDLGSAKCFQTAELEGTITKLGKRGFPIHAFTAPEALENPQKLNPRSDIYALGALLYFLLAGHPPYSAPNEELLMEQIIGENPRSLQELRPGLSESLVSVVECAMERDLDARYDSVEKMRKAFCQATGKDEKVSTPISILFLAADPIDASRLRLGEEFQKIQEELKRAKLRDHFRLELPQLSVQPKDISQALLDVQPQIVHFSGHGSASGALCFENQLGETHLVEPSGLSELFRQFADQIHCVVLNACYTEVQAKTIAQYIKYVIGVNQEIEDKAVIAFTIGFYQALGAGRTIEEAYNLGCIQMELQGFSNQLKPILIKYKV